MYSLTMWDKSSLTLPNPERKELAEMIREFALVLTYPAKKVYLEPGMVLDGIDYIAEGRTRHYMMAMDGTEKILYTLSEGWFFGETACSLGQPTGLYSKTEVRTTIYRIPLQAYNKLLGENKVFRDVIMRSCSKKMLIMRHEIENLTFNSCKDRLKRLLCSTADTSHREEGAWYNLKMHYTQYEISIIVGGARVTVSKLINELCMEGFIRMLNRNIQVNAAEYASFTRLLEEHRIS